MNLSSFTHSILTFKDKYPLIYKGSIWFLVLLYCYIESFQIGDYDIYLSGAQTMMQGGNPYSTLYHQWYHYLYSPFFGVLAYPLSLLPYQISAFIWLVGMAALGMTYILRWISNQSYFKLSREKQWLFEIILFLLTIRFLRDNFHLQQITIYILFLSVKGLEYTFRDHKPNPILGGGLLALGMNIKILPIIFIPYLIYRAKWKALLSLSIFTILFLFLPTLFIGLERTIFLTSEWLQLINPLQSKHIIDNEEVSFHSLTTVISVFFHQAAQGRPDYNPRRYIMDLSAETVTYLIQFIRFIFVIITLWILRTLPFKSVSTKKYYLELAWLFVCIPLIFPHQQFYAFIMFLPMLSIYVYHFIGRYKKGLADWLIMIIIVFLL